ncbi:MAG: ribosome maturation factor RimM [Candidatus Binatia bacterium]
MWKRDDRAVALDRASKRLIQLGELVATHGIEGWLRLKPYNPQSRVFSLVREIFLEKDGVTSPHILELSRAHKGHVLVKLQGTNEIDQAKKWVGFVLSVAEDVLQPLRPGEYYYYQVLGFDVFDTRGEWIGKITRIWFKEGGDLYVVAGSSRDYLIPAAKEVVEKLDLRAGKMIINPPEGLLDV